MQGILKTFFIDYFPWVGKYKRWFIAAYHTFAPLKSSYSQSGEDVLLYKLLGDLTNKSDIDYVDVGANHPSDISNTYLLHRKGFRGVAY